VLRSIVKDMGSPKGVGQFARFLRDHPDKFPMFSMVPDQVPSTRHVCNCKATLRRFSCEKREAGHTPSAIFGAFMNICTCTWALRQLEPWTLLTESRIGIRSTKPTCGKWGCARPLNWTTRRDMSLLL